LVKIGSFKKSLLLNAIFMKYILSAFILFILSCNTTGKKTIGSIEKTDPALDAILDTSATIEILGEGFDWTEGPLWIANEKMLLFSDIPKNTIHKWTEEKGIEIYLTPSGYTGSAARGGETGSNGLILNKENKLVLCQHGNRQMAWMDADINSPKAVFKTIADNYGGKKLNSPNDAAYRNNGDLYFTDPPYGLEKNMEDPLKEISYQGLYCVKPGGEIKLLTDSITRPNGVAFTNDFNSVIVANSDPEKPFWYIYDIGPNDSLTNGRIFYNAKSEADKKEPGLPDGLKVDKNGNVFATGPGGVWIFDKNGKVLGKIKIPVPVANCAFTDDGKTLFLTADMYLLRVKLK
jgi:gluconolactonase